MFLTCSHYITNQLHANHQTMKIRFSRRTINVVKPVTIKVAFTISVAFDKTPPKLLKTNSVQFSRSISFENRHPLI